MIENAFRQKMLENKNWTLEQYQDVMIKIIEDGYWTSIRVGKYAYFPYFYNLTWYIGIQPVKPPKEYRIIELLFG